MASRPLRPPRAGGVAALAFAATLAVVAAVVGTAFVVASAAAERGADASARLGLVQAADLTAQLLAGRGRSLAGGARVFVQGPYFRALVVERSRDDVLDQALEAAAQLEADWVFITDQRGVLVAKSDEPGAFGVALGDVPLVAAALAGGTATGYGASGDSLLFQAVAAPIVVPGSAPVGVLVATRVVDAALARDVRAATGAEVVFYTLDATGARYAGASSLDDAAARAALRASEASAARLLDVHGTRYAAQRSSLATAGGELVGGFLVLRARDPSPPGVTGVRQALLAAFAVGLLLAAAIAALAHRTVGAPARALASAAHRALGADHDGAIAAVRAAPARRARGEIASLAAAVGTLVADLRDRRGLAALVESARDARDAPGTDADRATPIAGGARRRAVGALHAPRPAPVSLPRIGTAPAPGDVLAERWAIEAEIGAGGLGIVYRARDVASGAAVAVKVLRPELAADPRAGERLAHELRLARRVAHRNVVRAFELGAAGDARFVVMELVDGASLADVLRARGALPEPAVRAIAVQLARALDAAHAEGVVHGDLKPANLLLARDGTLKVADFGVAALVHRPGGARDDDATHPSARLGGAIVGTPEYVAPEVLLGGAPTVRADVYSAGIVLRECLDGVTAYERDTPREFLARKLDAEVPPAAEHADRGDPAPGTLAHLVARMAAADRDARPATARAVLAELARLP